MSLILKTGASSIDVSELSADSEPEILSSMTMKEKLEMAISKKVNVMKTASGISKTMNSKLLYKVIKQELAYFEVEHIRGKYLQLVYDCLMSIPPTSVESERAFSAAGLLCTKIRSSLSDKTFDSLTFLRAYFKGKSQQ